MSVTFQMKNFPAGRSGVLLPQERRTAALGVCMYTASKPSVLRAQSAAHALVRIFGPHVLPGRFVPWTPPHSVPDWQALQEQWEALLGPITAIAVYHRRQTNRSGLTVTATNNGRPVAVIKVRPEGEQLAMEQQALSVMHAASPSTFSVPQPLGSGAVTSALHWSAQSVAFDRPHFPDLFPSRDLFDEVTYLLNGVFPKDDSLGLAPAHNDLTPWNLRRDHRGRSWLFDWEDCALSPIGTDRAYFSATAHAVRSVPMPRGLPGAAVEHCRSLVSARPAESPADQALRARLLAALELAAGSDMHPDR